MKDLKWFKELCLQLPVLFDLGIFAVQSNFITGSIVSRLDVFIVGPFLKFLNIVEVFFGIKAEFVVFFIRHIGEIATIQLENRVAGACILGVSYW